MANREKVLVWVPAVLIMAALASAIVNPVLATACMVLAIIPIGLLVPVEYMLAAAAFLLPLAPHTMVISERLPSLTVDYLFVAVCGLLFLYPAIKNIRRMKSLWLIIGCWAGFGLIAVVSWLVAGNSLNELLTINRFGYFAALLVMAAAIDPDRFNLRKVFRAFYAAAFVVALFGLVQYFFYSYFYNDLYILSYMKEGMDPGYYNRIYDRVLSSFGNPHTVGLYLAMMLITAAGSNFWGFNSRWSRILWVVVLLTAIVLTRSRTVYICLLAGYLLVALFSNKNWVKFAVYGMAGGLALYLTFAFNFLSDNWLNKLLSFHLSVQARFMLWAAAMDRFLASPIVGGGPNLYVRAANGSLPPSPVDNIYLTVLSSFGLLGFLMLLFLLLIIARQLIKLLAGGYTNKNLARGLGCALVILLIANLSGDFLFHTRAAGSFILMLGCFWAAAQKTSLGPQKILLVGNANSIHVQRWGQALAEQGLAIHILSPGARYIRGCTVHEVKGDNNRVYTPAGLLNLIKTILSVERIIKKVSPDVVHIHGAFSFGWYAAGFTGPIITSVWGGDVYRFAPSSRVRKMLVRNILTSADKVSVPSRQVAGYVKTEFGIKDAVILPWGIDETVFHPQRNQADVSMIKKMLQIPETSRLVLSPRSLAPQYNVETILESIPGVLKVYENACFCFLRGAGDADYEKKLQKQAAILGINQHVRWVSDMLSAQEMARMFRAAKAFISIPDTDNLGSTIIEGLACGCVPVVKRLDNYQILYATGAVMYSINEVNPGSLTAALVLALNEHSEQAQKINSAAALQLGTWSEAVHKMKRLYFTTVERRYPDGEKM